MRLCSSCNVLHPAERVMPRYNPSQIEPKWQKYWEENRTFATPREPNGEKLYVLDMFPYPSGDGLHVGHPEGYTATDIVARFARMRGKTVLHPMGFDAFGLPAEEHAIKTGTPPRIGTQRNMDNFRRQLKMLGFSYDWDRELATIDREYFRWTQWIFLLLFDTWYDRQEERGRPISELPIPDEIREAGVATIREYQDEHRLAYQSYAPVNWCPALGTVLANEEVVNGLSERGQHPVVRMPLRQWMLRITAYADRLENDLEGLDWSPGIKTLQRDWIGRSTGAEVDFFVGAPDATENGTPTKESFHDWTQLRAGAGFPVKPSDDVLRVYTTRPDTLYGATFMVIAPEHPLVERLTTADRRADVKAYQEQATRKSDRDRRDQKTGVFTGAYALNPVNAAPVPIWIADYVLMGYGTGAIMAVPAHDQRDLEFALAYRLPVKQVVSSGDSAAGATEPEVGPSQIEQTGQAYPAEGNAINSGPYDGLSTGEFKQKIVDDLENVGVARAAVNYQLRDWLFSRQRFWGEPFPILHELDSEGKPTGVLRAVEADQLPVDLPELEDFKPHGRPEPPLEKAPEEWLYPVIDGVRYKRETNTMPQWAGSCWYYLRYIDPKNDQAMVDPELEKLWMPVDLYVGGAEHAVLHLLYARFWHKVLYDRGYVTTKEPFAKLVNQGMILGEMEFTGYRRTEGGWISASAVKRDAENNPIDKTTGQPVKAVRVQAEYVEKQGDSFVLTAERGIHVDSRAYKMSKSRGNVVNPDEVVTDYGADSLRLYEMFMGPLEAVKPWSMTGVNGVRGFLDRVWRMIVAERSETLELHAAVQDVEPTKEQNRMLHKTIQSVTADIERMDFNTGIARMMEFTNYFTKEDRRPRQVMEQFVLLLSPYAPHLAEELWQLLGHSESLAYHPWPKVDEAAIREETQEIPVQINGKLRGRIEVAPGASKEELIAAAQADEKVAALLSGAKIVKSIAVPGRMVNFVVQ